MDRRVVTKLWKLAGLIFDECSKRTDVIEREDEVIKSTKKLNTVMNLLGGKHRSAALTHFKQWMYHNLRVASNDLLAFCQRLFCYECLQTCTSQRDIYEDLVFLHQHHQIDFQKKTITFTTDDIVLEDVDLGEFEIEYDIVGESYSVVALNPPLDNMHHPHVRGGSLCEGDGSEAISLAINQGRLCDMFDLIVSILNTYNGSSPHYDISHWKGEQCEGCGCYYDEDDMCSCGAFRCRERLCGDCMCSCHECENLYCSNHISSCDSCDESTCTDCLRSSSYHAGKICSACHRELEEEAEQEEEERRRQEEEAEEQAEEDAEDKALAEDYIYQLATGFPPFEENE